MMTSRTRQKIDENLGLLKDFLEKKYGKPVDDDTEQILFSALSWTAEDVAAQMES